MEFIRPHKSRFEKNFIFTDGDADSVLSLMPLGEAEENESHAYVPYVYARDMIAKIMNDMKNMKVAHLNIVDEIGKNYKSIEDSTQVGHLKHLVNFF